MRYVRRCVFVILTLCCTITTAYAQPWAVEAKAGAFFPLSKKVMRIFDTAMPFVDIEGKYQFSDYWEIWGGAGCIFDQGNSLGCNNRTSIQIYPFTLGVKRLIVLAHNLNAFIGLGGLWSLLHNQDHSKFVEKSIRGNTFGGLARLGVQYQLRERVAFSLFTEYLYQKFYFHKVYKKHVTARNDVDLSGFKLGLGVVYDF